MEVFDLYDKERIKTGRTMVRGDPVPAGFYRIVVHICIFNSRGEMLIQQRQPFKRSWSNMWDLSVGGAVSAGETSSEAAHREVFEELGLDIDFTNIRPKITINFTEGFDDIYIINGDYDLSEITLQTEEVKSAKWENISGILSMIDSGAFIPYNKALIELLFWFKDGHTGCYAADGKE